MNIDLYNGDCLDILKNLPDNSIDSIVTDPPYGLSFMGKRWDYDVPSTEVWVECLRVLKPGGHLLAFAGARTQHRMAVRIEDAGFEIRDMIAWVYGSGFPKSLDVSKANDKAAGVERESNLVVTTTATDAARQWKGWGTALKPAMEPITVARKPLIGTVAENVLAHGTGALNIDGCRVEGEPVPVFDTVGGRKFEQTHTQPDRRTQQVGTSDAGRWPANLIHSGEDEVVGLFPDTGKSSGGGGIKAPGKNGIYGAFNGHEYGDTLGYGDTGSAARFFYCAKASKADRGEGNIHPTVKPTDLMRYLCRLVTPPNGIVLDPFMGSGSTGKAAVLEGFSFVGIELSQEYFSIAKSRIEFAKPQENLFS